jgi:aminoglycoside 3-N-acetyltransferase I
LAAADFALIDVERLGPAQLSDVREAMRVFADAFDEQATFSSDPPSDAYFEKLLSNPHFVMLVARINGTVVGALAGYELVKYEQERSEFYIYDLAVAEPFRRRGIARMLIEALKPIARSAGAWVIFVQADREDEPAVALYRSMGIEEAPLHFDIPLN